ncbi:MAG: hypothetical protein HY749_20575 [Gammaproteobacteria bacterium]|nr:hypothetical protein [Gammaproteobacteria bacterium]
MLPHPAPAAPAAFVRDRHRRLLDLVRTLEASREEDERVELVSRLAEELATFVALEDDVLGPWLAARAPDHFGPGSMAAARRAGLISLTARLEAAPAAGPEYAAALEALAARARAGARSTSRRGERAAPYGAPRHAGAHDGALTEH